ncbi:MAG: UDP-glucose 4-epimerase GalE [Bacteroidota bacterium]
MKHILVTGGTGYIGSHTVVALQQEGYEVTIVDNLSNSNVSVLDQIAGITGKRPAYFNFDLCNEQEVSAFINGHPEISDVIHFAAYKAVGESVQFPLKYYRNNLYALINLLSALDSRPVNFVFSSSCTVYGQPDNLPVNETAPIKTAESPYGNTKQVAEEILSDLCTANPDYKVISLRYFNPVGAHKSTRIGELPMGIPQNLVPFITQSAIGKRGAITVYGDDYNTPDGSCIRDYIHVVDLAKAHIAALKRLKQGESRPAYEVFNVGTGKGTSVLEMIRTFETVTGTNLNYGIGPRRQGDIEQVWGDVTKAESLLNWRAEYNLEEMLTSSWAWEKALANAIATPIN